MRFNEDQLASVERALRVASDDGYQAIGEEAALRMLMNNLDPEVAERPDELNRVHMRQERQR